MLRDRVASALYGFLLALALAVTVHASPVRAEQDGAGEVRRGIVQDDLFLSGRSVDLDAIIEGDLFVAGGWVDLRTEVSRNLVAAGAIVDVRGRTASDLIAVAGMLDVGSAVGENLVAGAAILRVDGPIAGKLFAAGGRIRIGRTSVIAGTVGLAGASIEIAGTLQDHAVVRSGTVLVSGRVEGDLEVTALSLELTDGAHIGGNLVYYGPEPPAIAEGATVLGETVHEYEPRVEEEPPATPQLPVFWLLVTLGLGLILDLLLPRYLQSAAALLGARPFASFGLGLSILVVTPVIIVILIISILGIAIGIAAIAAYGTLLLLGPVIALFAATDLIVGRLWPPLTKTPARRRLAFVGALLVLGLLGLIPYVGTPLFWAILVWGLGAATWQLYESVRATPAATPASTGASP